MAKQCKYECGTEIEWNDEQKRFFETEDPSVKHDYKRCGEILRSQGKTPNFPENPNYKKNFTGFKKY